MPLSINVGLSRKASRNYQSTGVSINVTAELDQSLLAKPQELQRQIDGLYAQAEDALDRQVGSHSDPRSDPRNQPRTAPQATSRPDDRPRGNGQDQSRANGRNGTNGHPRAGTSAGNGAQMTASQKRAIEAIADRLGLDPSEEIRQAFGLDFDRLSLREASKVIDHLKGIQPQTRGNGR
jgi:hypothetical protein